MAASSAQDLAKEAKAMKEYLDEDIAEVTKYLDKIISGAVLDPSDLNRLIPLMIKSINHVRRKGSDKLMKRISESRGIATLTTFAGNKQEFQEWSDKLINQFNVTHPGSRVYLREIIKQVNITKSP